MQPIKRRCRSFCISVGRGGLAHAAWNTLCNSAGMLLASFFLLGSLSSAFAYVPALTPRGIPMRWKRPVKMNLAGNPTNLSNLSPSDFFQGVVRGLQRWKYSSLEEVTFDYWQGTNSQLFPAKSERDGLSTISFSSGSTFAPKLSPHVLGITQVWYNADNGEIMEADITLNDHDYIFTSDPQDTSGYGGVLRPNTPGKNRVYVQNVITHELGHAFGLSHSGRLQATMLFTESPEQAHLSCDDQIGIQALYPPSGMANLGTITGRVHDHSGIPVFGAHVVAVSGARGAAVASGITQPDGRFTVDALEPGSYYLYAEPYYAGPSALPVFYSKVDSRICAGQTPFSRTFLTSLESHDLLPTEIKRGLISDVGTVSVHCNRTGGASLPFEGSHEERTRNNTGVRPPLIEGAEAAQGTFAKVDRFGRLPEFQVYRLNALSGYFEIHALAYSLYSPIHVSLTLLNSEGTHVSAEIQDPVYRGDSGYINHDTALIAYNLPLGNYWLKVSGERLSSRAYPAPSSLDRVPFFILTGKWSPSAPVSFPKNARCTMQENYPPYESPPGYPLKNSLDTPSHAGFCGGLSTSHPGDDRNPPGGAPPLSQMQAAFAWFLPWFFIIALGWARRKPLPLAQNKVASYAQ